MAGAWTMTEDGEFVLDETYAEHLRKCKHAGSVAWQRAVFEYIENITSYNIEFLAAEFRRRATEENLSPTAAMDEFVIEALEGNL